MIKKRQEELKRAHQQVMSIGGEPTTSKGVKAPSDPPDNAKSSEPPKSSESTKPVRDRAHELQELEGLLDKVQTSMQAHELQELEVLLNKVQTSEHAIAQQKERMDAMQKALDAAANQVDAMTLEMARQKPEIVRLLQFDPLNTDLQKELEAWKVEQQNVFERLASSKREIEHLKLEAAKTSQYPSLQYIFVFHTL